MNCCSHLFEIDNFTPNTPNGPVSRSHRGGDLTSEKKSLLVKTPPGWLADKLGSSTEHVP